MLRGGRELTTGFTGILRAWCEGRSDAAWGVTRWAQSLRTEFV